MTDNQQIRALCRICGSESAVVRPCEVEVARITGRAHVDCDEGRGHSQYRHLTLEEWRQLTPKKEPTA